MSELQELKDSWSHFEEIHFRWMKRVLQLLKKIEENTRGA